MAHRVIPGPVPAASYEKEPRGGGCYVGECGDCGKKVFTLALKCICWSCGAWLEFHWPATYTAPAGMKGKA